MLKLDLDADINNIPYLLYMTEQEENEQEKAETAYYTNINLSFCCEEDNDNSCDDDL